MIINLSVAVDRIINECNIQTSHDLQAMRVQAGDAVNAIYDDWVLTEHNREEIYYAMQDICADMAFVMRTLLHTYSAGRDVISVDLENASVEANEGAVLEGMLRKYLKHSLLAWWYTARNTDLAAVNSSMAESALSNLFTQCLPRVSTSVGRYF